jgi:hypothetical protein
VSRSAVEHGLASRLVRNALTDVSTESAAILKCGIIEVHDD